MTAFTDANSHQTLYSYGNAQELTGVSYPDGSGFRFLYTDQGRVRQVTNGRGHSIALSYDGAGRLHQASFPTTSEPSITANYDAAGRVNGFTDGVGATSYTYRLNGWLSKVVYDYSASGLANAQELDYAYNADGILASLTWKNGSTVVGTWSYGYDAGGRLISLTNPFSETTTWTYDGEGKLLTQSNANGTSTAYGYNQQRGWPTSITHYSGSTAFASYGLTYDNGSNTVGNLTGVTEADGSTVSYGYDALYRLTGEQRTGTAPGGHTFGYDLAGNLTSLDSSNATYDSANKITNSGFAYDGDGDLTGDGTNTYTWDDRSNLTSRTVGGLTSTYGYDARGLRVISQVGMGIKTFYVFAGDTLIGEINGAGVVQAAYTWGAAGLASERLVPSGKSLWYHFGPQGETRQLTDGTGAVADSYVYSAYGQPLASAGTDANPFRYGGKYGYYTDVGAGLVLCTRRWYDPNTARWLSRDPSGYDGGDNLYAYCQGDPVNLTDPTGLQDIALPFPRFGFGAGAAGVGAGAAGEAGAGIAAGAAGETGAGLVAAGPVGLGIIVAGAGVAIGLPIGNAIGNHFFGPQTYTGYGPTFPPIMHAKGARENTGKNQGENKRAKRATRNLDDDEQDDFHHDISRDADFNNASPEDLKEEADALRKSRELPGRSRWKGKMPKGGRGRSKGDIECP